MTVDARTTAPASRSRRRWVVAAVILAIMAPLGLAVAMVMRADSQYGSLSSGGFGGYATPDKFSHLETGSPQVSADGAQFMESISNHGSHSVRISSIDRSFGVSKVQWTAFDWSKGVIDYNGPWQDFPAVVPGHGTIKILLTLQRPSSGCPSTTGDQEGASLLLSPDLTVHWESLMFSHTSDLSVPNQTVVLC